MRARCLVACLLGLGCSGLVWSGVGSSYLFIYSFIYMQTAIEENLSPANLGKPFRPFEQLMAVMPARSGRIVLPE